MPMRNFIVVDKINQGLKDFHKNQGLSIVLFYNIRWPIPSYLFNRKLIRDN